MRTPVFRIQWGQEYMMHSSYSNWHLRCSDQLCCTIFSILQILTVLPLAIVHTMGNLFTNVSLGRVAVSFTHTIKVWCILQFPLSCFKGVNEIGNITYVSFDFHFSSAVILFSI